MVEGWTGNAFVLLICRVLGGPWYRTGKRFIQQGWSFSVLDVERSTPVDRPAVHPCRTADGAPGAGPVQRGRPVMASVEGSVVTDPELVSGRRKPVLRLKARPLLGGPRSAPRRCRTRSLLMESHLSAGGRTGAGNPESEPRW